MTATGLATQGSLRARYESWRGELAIAWASPAVRRGVVGATLLLAGALSPAYLPGFSPLRSLTSPFLGNWAFQTAVASLMLVGVVVLFDAWLRLRPRAGVETLVTARATLTWWCLPLLVAPPLFSSDSFSYAAQGRLVSEGIDPYQYGPLLGPSNFRELVDPLWLYTPAPYGPWALQINRIIVDFTGGNAWWSAVLMRLPALVGVGLLFWALRRLAATFGVDPAKAVWWGVLNPVVVMHFIGGSHNDSLMVGLGAVALVLAAEGFVGGSAAMLAVAALVKQPIGFLLPATIALALAHRHGTPRPRFQDVVRGSLASGAAFAGTFVAGTLMSGLGFGWIGAAGVPGSVGSLSPSTNLGKLLEWTLGALHAPASAIALAMPSARVLVVVVGLGLTAYFALRCLHDASRAPAYICWGMLAVAACLPALQAWYLLWGGVFIGLVALSAHQERIVLILMVAVLGYSTIDAVFRTGLVSFVILGVAGVALTLLTRRRLADPVEEFDRTVGEAVRTEFGRLHR